MELGELVANGASVGPPGLAGAELPEVLGGPGHDVVEELHLDAAKGLALRKSVLGRGARIESTSAMTYRQG